MDNELKTQMEDCIFCKITAGEIMTNFVAEKRDVLAFYDTNPQASTHILILPKQHIRSFLDIKSTQSEIIWKMIEMAQSLIKKFNLGQAFKMTFNGGKYQHVPHLHWHLLSDILVQKGGVR